MDLRARTRRLGAIGQIAEVKFNRVRVVNRRIRGDMFQDTAKYAVGDKGKRRNR